MHIYIYICNIIYIYIYIYQDGSIVGREIQLTKDYTTGNATFKREVEDSY